MHRVLKLFVVINIFFTTTNFFCQQKKQLPNILWITCEDISPYLGTYGFKQAQTPNLDKLAKNGLKYTNAYANAPVCGVARSTLLTGMYAPTTGTQHMRTNTQLPKCIPAYPKVFREAGYYCTNNFKKDYNSSYINDETLWDESSAKAYYKNRKEGQPFFSVFNIITTHESRLAANRIEKFIKRKQIPKKTRIEHKDIILPPYHPDVPEIRNDWARLHDLITLMDKQVGDLLNELKEQNLDKNTIVFFYSDHGGMLSRAKRYLFNVGTQVPFIVHIPEKWQHLAPNYKQGGTENKLVSFVDFPKTIISLAGLPIPDKMQGHVFLGKNKGKNKGKNSEYVHFYRDRMSERYDFNRAITDGTYYYIQNFNPHRPRGRSTRYGYKVQQNWRANEASFEAGKSNAIQSQFYLPKPTKELFITPKDPWHVNNIADSIKYKRQLKKMSKALDRWMIENRDTGLIPEPMFHDFVGEGKTHATIYEFAQSNAYKIASILPKAKLAALGKIIYKKKYLRFLKHKNPIIRYWGAYGLFRIAQNEPSIQCSLIKIIEKDTIPVNRLMAAQALGASGQKKKAFNYIYKALKKPRDGHVFLFGLNALQYSHTDTFLTKEDWLAFKNKTFTNNKIDRYGKLYSKRIISDALSLWPNRRTVD